MSGLLECWHNHVRKRLTLSPGIMYPAGSSRMSATFYTQIESPLGPLLLVADDAGLRQILFVNGRHLAKAESSWKEDRAPLSRTIRQLQTYFAGELENFDLQLAPEGTPFQLEVWRRLCDIPYGETISYGELASRIGNPKASRAVGLANGSNPIPIVIPCHRVIGSNGKLTGYGGGLPIKEKLLALERRQLRLL
jgi:methylated-DNA-[protein]-cysteine S-methyltransferase